ncbi:UNKNOWN [Stylonychia lemnae]|uniref:AB hydrolase-1 domain-containing protein n=1 Tax=Stylonychia lemnae TaxID=5949 RepID=A0A077ZTG3_STYLE|nr:UNKNOWN [Stylonychia lemnae]|eukprot:CDW71751.1 UNKNOWN [Stylonychia lemnae]
MGNKINLQIANDLQTQIVTKLTGLTLNENIHILNIRLEEEKNDYLNTIVVDKTKDHNNEKQTMVILHGYGAAATVFYRVFKGLGENFRLLIVDLYGFGQSTRIKAEKTKLKKNIEASENYFTEPIEQWRQQMGINEKFILVGHSFGGYVASAYALKYPQNIQKLMLLSPAGFSKFSQQGNSDALNQNQSGSFINRKLAQSAEYFWNKDISAFDLFRKLGFAFTAKFVDSFLKQNSPDISKEEKKLMKQYLTQIFLFPSSGEYAVNQLIHANGQTRDCLLTRIEQIRHQVPITFVYGDTDWMHGQKEVRDRDHRVQSRKPQNL